MKATTILFATILPMYACGTATSSAITHARSNRASQAQADDTSTPALSAASVTTFTDAYASLDPSVITSVSVTAFTDDALFADVDVSNPIRSASFGHTTTVRIPAGVTSAPADPNQATTFYVAYGASTNQAAATYGPFVVTQNGLGMTATKVAAVIAASEALAASAFTADNAITAFPACAQFADVDNTPVHLSASFGHTITLLVPAGITGEPADPDLASTYFVRLGDCTNAAGGTYGPFSL